MTQWLMREASDRFHGFQKPQKLWLVSVLEGGLRGRLCFWYNTWSQPIDSRGNHILSFLCAPSLCKESGKMDRNEDSHQAITTGSTDQEDHPSSDPAGTHHDRPDAGLLAVGNITFFCGLARHDHTQGFGTFDFTEPSHLESFHFRTGKGYKGKEPRNQSLIAAKYREYTNKHRWRNPRQKILLYMANVLYDRNRFEQPFRLLDLPQEVRDTIYGFILEPLLDDKSSVDGVTGIEGGIFFYVESGEDWDQKREDDESFTIVRRYPADAHPGDPQNDPDHYLNVYQRFMDGTTEPDDYLSASGFFTSFPEHVSVISGLSEYSESPTLTDSEDDSDSDDSEDGLAYEGNPQSGIADHEWVPVFGCKLRIIRKTAREIQKSKDDCARHPYARQNFPCKCVVAELNAYEAIRCISHVSRQVSLEVGNVMWRNSTLLVDELNALPAFARHHPMALRQIKKLAFTLTYEKDLTDTLTSELSLTFAIIRRYMALQYISIAFHTTNDCLREVLEGKKIQTWRDLFKNMKMNDNMASKKGLEIRRIDGIDPYDKKLPDQYDKLLAGLWVPDCVRESYSKELGLLESFEEDALRKDN
ncbi:hypothetical protein HYALB_00013921 [Hymenoscyphus albidus]|uniref:Uncharacterized protein n=1 Tax=Hymenoscyphus albidus TaxID=595503 RepID=A0A9N9QC17_9HELO|nr:hypothetical protein HYALB_00013921 [Hymenoscyphus albidus]